MRAELFSADEMERHGATLAAFHTLDTRRGRDQLLTRLSDNEKVLAHTYGLLTRAVQQNRRITPAGEWLLDNFYLIEEQIRTARAHLPKGYSRELPVLASGPSKGLTRVYDIALEVISHGDGRIDKDNLIRFLTAYQRTTPLKLGELWAIPIVLRLALIENLRRISLRVADGVLHRNQASDWAEQMLLVAEQNPKDLILVISDMARSNPPMVTSFVAELARCLQGHSTALALPLTWIEQRLAESGLTIENMVQSETQSQAINQVCISNTIGSLRLLGAMDWREFVESLSTMESKLREDPSGVYCNMDFATRDRYRHQVEDLARRSGQSECDVARKAVQLAHAGLHAAPPAQETRPREAHVGFYLIDSGLAALERAVGVRRSVGPWLAAWAERQPLMLYLGCIATLTLAFTAQLMLLTDPLMLGYGALLALGVLAVVANSQLAVALVNWLVTLLTHPHALPRMDYSEGIDPSARTLVVVPTILSSLAAADDLAEALEVRFLANQDPCLHFGLLTDYRDAQQEATPDDAPLLARLTGCIQALNAKYPREVGDTFYLFHRPRRWNAMERMWMGFERKRGKLGALNALLRGAGTEAFSHTVGNLAILQKVRYVITLDTDTQLQRDTARQFAATLAHPLNHARWDPALQRVTAGYGILQPRMAVSLTSINSSLYARLCGSEPGVDPYTRAVSDVYQDLFQEGSFIGKGIYDVDTFELALQARFPDNRILSHDLLEGCYARSGLISDVQLYDDYPVRYDTDVARRQRWIRGDWQIASWLLPHVPGPVGRPLPNLLSGLSQWKILDNLRRSLVPVSLIALWLSGWFLVPAAAAWTLSIIGILTATPLLASVLQLLSKPSDIAFGQHLVQTREAAGWRLAQVLLNLAWLPHEAYYSVGAVVRTNYRMLISNRRLLEWAPSNLAPPAQTDGLSDLMQALRNHWIAPATAISVGVALAALRPEVLAITAPLLILWLLAPGLAWWVSRIRPPVANVLDSEQTAFLHRLARRTWGFFETFVTAADHWLAPDNYQEHPAEALAHRTSPTNIGMALLANLTAYDFGYISAGALLQRTHDTFASMHLLERHAGHFYNWYDTQTLQPLAPRYISAVDSGNLSGHLLTLRPGLLGLAERRIICPQVFAGLEHALGNLKISLEVTHGVDALQHLQRLQTDVDAACDAHPCTVASIRQWLDAIAQSSGALLEWTRMHVAQTPAPTAMPTAEFSYWARALHQQCQSLMDDLDHLLPWKQLPTLPAWLGALPGLGPIPTLRELATLDTRLTQVWQLHARETLGADGHTLMEHLRPLVHSASARAQERLKHVMQLAQDSTDLAQAEYALLYDTTRHLLAVGYNVDDARRDTGHYDLLASEARLGSFVAIAQGKLPQENWFALGRLLTTAGGNPILLSWSGSMFEYLMPQLVMPAYANTLLDQTAMAVVKRQISYGKQRAVPWGISESGFNTVDTALNYQYRAFGIPGLGLKRGLADDLVVAPYASALALMVLPDAACQNLQRLTAEGLLGRYGMYEAIDYTPARLPRGQSSAVVRSFMAHHQGMSLLALAYALLGQPMQKRFVSDPEFQATLLLLQERIPHAAVIPVRSSEPALPRISVSGAEMPIRVLRNTDTSVPEVQLLSNGRYHVMVSQSGGGYSRWKDFAVTRWREDGTRDHWGGFCYLRDVASGEFWSTAYQPTAQKSDTYEALFSEGRAEFRRRDHQFETHTEIVVSPEDDMELRRVHITNRSRTRRTIEITSYAEVVLTAAASDAVHPAFSNLFVQTEILPDLQAIVCHRRARSTGEQLPWLFHVATVHGGTVSRASYETDRMRFIGRTRSPRSPLALLEVGPLDNNEGSVLDPIVAIRYFLTLDPQQTTTVDIATGVGDSRDTVLRLIGKYRDRHLADRVLELARTHSWVNLQQINATESDAQLFSRLASSVIYTNPTRRADAAVLARNRRGQSGLWGYGISGDLPIVLLQVANQESITLVRQMVQAHAYWRVKGLTVDLVIWNEDHAGYRQALQDQIMGLIAAGSPGNYTDRPGGIFVRVAEQMSQEDRTLFQTVARVIITDTRGTLAEQVNRRGTVEPSDALLTRLTPVRQRAPDSHSEAVQCPTDLQFFNGTGGFSSDGSEYVILTQPHTTPAPWVNVIANAQFGTVISESGSAYTWSENAHEFRYTPWDNDPVSDPSGEAYYLRDEESGAFWSPTALPCAGQSAYLTRHGFGYSSFEHIENGIHSLLTVFVDLDVSIKFSVLKLRNLSGRSRRLSATGYVEWVLGDLRAKTAMHVVTEIDTNSGAIFAQNAYNPDFGDRMAFFDADSATREEGATFTGSRREFIGRNGSLANPVAMGRTRLSNRVGAGLDPCAAIQIPLELAEGQEREIVFRLGATGRRGSDDASARIQLLRDSQAAQTSLAAVRAYWAHTLGAVQVQTPDAALNVLANGWLLYQTMACRLWARSGYYQSGGAFGYRDQLQDTMALVHNAPQLLREQVLRCCARQFVDGDVQHWWHPPQGRGVRTRCSDDFLWLPQAVCRYLSTTGDHSLLLQSTGFLDGRAVNAEDDSYYDLPGHASGSATVYEHCVKAIRRGLSFGTHGLPLMGSGDWNDGMNLVGIKGRGESVWLGFLLFDTLTRFSAVAKDHGDGTFAMECLEQASSLRRNIDQHGWDGGWYRRAYFDDGTPLGSENNAECQIDSISQSWAVLSGAGDVNKTSLAMNALDKHLVKRDSALIQLLTPPFDHSDMNPGYIKGYVPGVRENGGQYTHAAIWATMAFAARGDSLRAWACFDLINPVRHGDSVAAVATYKVEPYVVAADVYAVAPHVGRGGWTWYTGSASWMYRLIVESLLGLRKDGNQLHLQPCLPAAWHGFAMRYRFGDTDYTITVQQSLPAGSAARLEVDGIAQAQTTVLLLDDGIPHAVTISLSKADATQALQTIP